MTHWKPQNIIAATAPPLLAAVNELQQYMGIEAIPQVTPYVAVDGAAEEWFEWQINGNISISAILFSGLASMTGTCTFEFFNPLGDRQQAMTLNYAAMGAQMLYAWSYAPVGWFLPQGYSLKVKSSQAFGRLIMSGKPIILHDPILGNREKALFGS